MEKEKLLLSVLMTAYNRELYIKEAIESVLQSTFTEFELLIVDDCSTDKTKDIIKLYASKDKRVSFYENSKNKGDYPNRNYAASLARGTYIMFVDSDDKILKDGLKNCLDVMLNFPNLVFGLQNHDNKPSLPFYLNQHIVVKRHFFNKSSLMIGPGGMIIKRIAFFEINGFPEIFGPANDLFFNLKAAAKFGVIFLPFDFNYYRIHEFQERNNTYSYIYNNYNYLLTAISTLDLCLLDKEKKWILKKAKRRFIFNLLSYLFSSLNFINALKLIQYTKFTFKDMFEGIFHID